MTPEGPYRPDSSEPADGADLGRRPAERIGGELPPWNAFESSDIPAPGVPDQHWNSPRATSGSPYAPPPAGYQPDAAPPTSYRPPAHDAGPPAGYSAPPTGQAPGGGAPPTGMVYGGRPPSAPGGSTPAGPIPPAPPTTGRATPPVPSAPPATGTGRAAVHGSVPGPTSGAPAGPAGAERGPATGAAGGVLWPDAAAQQREPERPDPSARPAQYGQPGQYGQPAQGQPGHGQPGQYGQPGQGQPGHGQPGQYGQPGQGQPGQYGPAGGGTVYGRPAERQGGTTYGAPGQQPGGGQDWGPPASGDQTRIAPPGRAAPYPPAGYGGASGPGGPGGPGGYGGGINEVGPPPGTPPASGRKPGNTKLIVGIAIAVAVILILSGIAYYLGVVRKSDEFKVGACVKQQGSSAVLVDCSTSGAYRIDKQVSDKAQCDATQPFIVVDNKNGSKTTFCLKPK